MERRKKFQEEGRKLCREAIINKDIDFIVGIILYWTEGARSSNRSAVKFCNTDIDMIRIFISFLTKYFSINSSEICLQIYCWLNSEISLDAIESYWVTNLNLKKENLRKAYIEQKRKVTGKRKNVHLYGVCNIAINRTDIIQKIYGAIQEFTGVEKPKWLL